MYYRESVYLNEYRITPLRGKCTRKRSLLSTQLSATLKSFNIVKRLLLLLQTRVQTVFRGWRWGGYGKRSSR